MESGEKRLAPKGLGGRSIDGRFFTVVHALFYFSLGAVLSCARILENGAPFGMALVACSGASVTGVSALAGAALGYLISGGLEIGIRYIAAAVLVYTVSFIFHQVDVYKQSFFMPAVAALVMAVTGFLGSFSLSSGSVPVIAELFLETALAFGATYFFREALCQKECTTESAEQKRTVSVMITLSCVLMAVSRIEIAGTVSVGRILALLIVMTSAMKGGMLTGAAVGTVLGLAMDVTGVGAPFYTMAYALSGILSGVFGKHGRLIFVLSFILAGALGVVCAWDTEIYLSAIIENFCASVIFMLLPSALLNELGMMLQTMERGSGESGLRRYVAGRIQSLSDAYAQLFDVVTRSLTEDGNDENIARVFDRAADQVCAGCKFKNRCWNSDYMDTLSALNDATRAMSEHGTLECGDIPGFFREKCIRLHTFVTAVNGELRALAYRKQMRRRISESRSAAIGQYRDTAGVLQDVARELGSLNGSDPLSERRLIRFLHTLDIDAETAVYRDGSGRMHVIIESGRLTPLTEDEEYLRKLSEVVGVRLCLPKDASEGSSRLTLLEAEPLAVAVGIAAIKKQGEKISGDRGTYFKTDSGVLCVILSDGMGTGDDAARESGEVVAILEKFLRSGVDPAVAMKTLNSVMLLRDGDNWGYATVDLMCVDLFTGETCFYKYGAAPSYVRDGKIVKRIRGESFAPGLTAGDGVAPDLVRMRLKPGSTAIIASDGVMGEDDEWLKSLLLRAGEDMKALARTAVTEAEQLYGTEDDMTVVTVRLETRA